jgi:hypothetical protein
MSISPVPQIIPNVDIVARVAVLHAALLANDPQMPTLLAQIHRETIKYPELIHLLNEEQIGQIVGAYEKHSKIEIVGAALAKHKSIRGNKATVDDLG